MPNLTRDEMRKRWQAGNPDINDDGGENVLDLILASQFATESGWSEGEKLEDATARLQNVLKIL